MPANTAPEMEHYAIGDTAFLAGDRIDTILAGTDDGLAEDADDRDDHIFGSWHLRVVEFVFLDGHVEAIAKDIHRKALLALSTYAGGENEQK